MKPSSATRFELPAAGESEDTYREIFEHANDAIVIFAPEEERILEVNDKAAVLYGFGRDAMVGMSMKELTHDVSRGESQIQQLLERGSFHDFESIHFDSAGQPIDVLINSAVIHFRGQRAVLSINRDISGRKRTEEALRHSERSLREAQRIASIGSWCWWIDEDRYELSEEACRILGIAPASETLKAEEFQDRIAPDSHSDVAFIRERLREGFPVEVDVTITQPGGTIRYARMEGEPDQDSPQGRRRAIGTLQDITETRARTAELQASRADLTRAQRIAHLGNWEWEPATDTVTWSEEMYRIFGRDDSLPAPRVADFSKLWAPGSLGRAHAAVRLALEQGIPYALDLEGLLPDGTSIWVLALGEAVFDREGRIVGLRGTTQDITERRRTEEELERAERLSSLGRVAATMSHEFNNVLMGIQPFAEIVTRRAKDAPVSDAGRRILQSVQRGRSVTSALLRFTRPATPVMQSLDVHQWLPDAVHEFGALMPQGVALELVLGDEPLAISVDRDQLTQAVGNIVFNARDALAGSGGTIRLRVSRCDPDPSRPSGLNANGCVQIAISDDGPGISPEHIDRIFEPFFTTKQRGTGLGLAVVHQIITLHGGRVSVESRVGLGTTLHISLPSAPVEKTPCGDSVRAVSARLPSRILLVEDEEDVAEGLMLLLEIEGVGTDHAATGSEALEYMTKNIPEVVVLDVGLPDMSGLEVYETIRRLYPDVPVLFSSGHADRNKIAQPIDAHPVRLLVKPYDFASLLAELSIIAAGSERAKDSLVPTAV